MRGRQKPRASLKRPSWPAVRATLLGKLGEAIVSGYFTEEKKYELVGGVVHWRSIWRNIFNEKKDPEELTENDIDRIIQEEVEKKLKNMCCNVNEDIRRMVLDRMRRAIKKLKSNKNKRFNPDLVLRKNGRITVVEIQLWPVWLQRQHRSSKLTWKVIEKEGVALFPRVLAKSVCIRDGEKRHSRRKGKEEKGEEISEFLYVSYSRSDSDHNEIKCVFDAICPARFDILYFDEILKEVCGETWFLDFLKEAKKEIDKLFNGLRKGKLSW